MRGEKMRKVILYIAMSLDGLIAGPDDDLSFLHAYDGLKLVSSSYDELMSRIDTILLGRKTYDWVTKNMTWPYDGLNTIVFSTLPKSIAYGSMTSSKPKDVVDELRKQPGKDIWLIGGGNLAQSFLKDGLVDEMIIAVIPELIGTGVRLFEGSKSSWNFVKLQEENGLILISYERKKD